MSPDRLGTALRDLVDDVEQGVAPPVAGELWAGGRRRVRTARLVPVLAAACVAALVTLALWPGGAPSASVPAIGLDGEGVVRLTSYPSAIPKPPSLPGTQRPGVTAAVLGDGDGYEGLHAVSPGGEVRHLDIPDPGTSAPPAVSPDGRWLAQGPVLTDLVAGGVVPSVDVRSRLQSTRTLTRQAAWWSPDSRRVYVDGLNQGTPSSSGFVVGTDGSVTEAPLLSNDQLPIVAGWLDDETVMALVRLDGETDRFGARTWRVGSSAWGVAGADVHWPAGEGVVGASSTWVQAGLSPDATRLLVTRLVTDIETKTVQATEAMLFDARTGASLGMPTTDGVLPTGSEAAVTSLTWTGGGCRPAWRDGLPVTTDDGIRPAVDVLGDDLVTVSSRYGSACVAFAGNELRGTPAVDTVAVWQERLWVWGGRLLVLAGIVALVWWFTRGRSWRDGIQTPTDLSPFIRSRG